jgi:hypothetical protein
MSEEVYDHRCSVVASRMVSRLLVIRVPYHAWPVMTDVLLEDESHQTGMRFVAEAIDGCIHIQLRRHVARIQSISSCPLLYEVRNAR